MDGIGVSVNAGSGDDMDGIGVSVNAGSGDGMDGIGVSISGGNGAGVVGLCPFLLAALALLDWSGRFRVSIGNGSRSPFCARLSPLFEDGLSICCGKALVIGRRSLGVYDICGDGID